MPLDFQTVDVKFTQGLDTKNQPKLVIPGKWNQLDNATLSADGTPRRRDGMTALVVGANGNGLATHGKELLVVNGSAVSTVTTAQGGAVVAVRGEIGNVSVAKDEVSRSTAVIDSQDTAYGNGFSCHVWREAVNPVLPTGVKYSLVDEATGAKVFSEVLLSANAAVACPRVVFTLDAFFIFWIDDTPALQCVVVRVNGTPSQGARVALVGGSLGFRNMDAVSCDIFALGTPNAMVSYTWNDGTTSVRSISVTHVAGIPSIVAGPTNLITEVAAPYATLTAIACAPFNSTRAGTFVMSTTGLLLGRVTNTSWATVGATTLLDAGVVVSAGLSHLTALADASGVMNLFYDQRALQGTVGFPTLRTTTVDSALTIFTNVTIMHSASFDVNAARASGPNGPWIAGKAFRVGAKFFLPLMVQENYGTVFANTRTNNTQSTFFLIEAATGVVVTKALYGALSPDGVINIGGAIVAGTSTPCSVATLPGGVFSLDVTERTRLNIQNGINVSQAGAVRLKLTPNTSISPISRELGESTYFAGGVLSTFDGSSIVEHGFSLFPEGISVVAVGGGGAMTAGTHEVVVIYEWVDGGGNLHQSAPCLSVSVANIANDSLTVIIPTLLLTQKTGVHLVVYMTQAAGLTFNRVTSLSSPVPNITSASTVTVTVTASDASIAGNQILYTQPQFDGDSTTLANVAPAPASVIGLHQNRLFVDRADVPGGFRYSQQLLSNTGLQFSDLYLEGVVPVDSGGIVAFVSMDEKLIIFGSRKPYVLYGQGPDPTGTNSGYGQPQPVPADVGCSDARSVLPMPMGIIFKSAKGWYVLGRDLAVRYIGAGVEAYNAISVNSAVLLEDRQECRFLLSSGLTLVYSYDISDPDGDGQWSTFSAPAGYTEVDAVWWSTGGYYAHVSLTGGLNRDTSGVFLDSPGALSPATITTTGRTSWLHVGKLSGFQRIRWLLVTGTYGATSASSAFTVTVDFDDQYGGAPGAYSFTVASTAAIRPNSTASFDIRHKLHRQKCRSVAFTFVDVPTLANPSGVSLQGMTLQVGLKRGVGRLPAGQSVG